jgi:hypothetical protein
MDNIFFNFFKPFFDYIDSGKLFRRPFGWLYAAIAGINLLVPFYILYQAIDSELLSLLSGKFVFVFILVWILLVGAGWFSFQLWWNRKSKVENLTAESDEFVGTPVFSHLIQTFGEWLGAYVAIVGSLASLFASLFLGSEAQFLSGIIGFNAFPIGVAGIFLCPLYGFIIIGFFRFIAEQARALATIANNTKK